MARAYSLDLRKRVLVACDAGGASPEGRRKERALMSDDTPSQEEGQENPEPNQQEESGDLTLLSVRVPAKTVRNAKKAVACLMAPFWSDIKEFSHAFMQERIARLHLSHEQIKEQIRHIAPESETLQAGLLHVVADQRHMDEVTIRGLQSLAEKHEPQQQAEATEEIQTSWLRRFRKEVEGLGEEEMKEVFARVLAGEIEQPGSFSIQALRVLGTLDQRVAELFRAAASFALIYEHPRTGNIEDALLYSADMLSVEAGGLESYGLDYSTLTPLMESGLLSWERRSWKTYTIQKGHGIYLKCQGLRWLLSSEVFEDENPTEREVAIRGVEFTMIGRELLRIVDIEPHPEFIQALPHSFATLFFPPLELERLS